MRKRGHLSHGELMALVAMVRLGNEAYGVAIAREMESASGRKTALASLYLTLDRLEAQGLIESELGQPTPERGGRAKTFFRVTSLGVRELRETRQVLLKILKSMPALETL